MNGAASRGNPIRGALRLIYKETSGRRRQQPVVGWWRVARWESKVGDSPYRGAAMEE